jgi:hypothetical protein
VISRGHRLGFLNVGDLGGSEKFEVQFKKKYILCYIISGSSGFFLQNNTISISGLASLVIMYLQA